MNTDLTSLTAVLAALMAPAGITAWMLYVSNWFRNATANGTVKFDAPWKVQLAVAAASILPPVAAFLITTYVPAATLASASPTYAFFSTVALAYLVQQGWFALTNNNDSKTKVG